MLTTLEHGTGEQFARGSVPPAPQLTHDSYPYIMAYIHGRSFKKEAYGGDVEEAKLFMSGNSQAVRIPRAFRPDGDEVEIQRRGNTLVIRPKKQTWQLLIASLAMFTDDFMEEGRQ